MSLAQGPFTDLQVQNLQILNPDLENTPLSTDNSGNVIAFNGFASLGATPSISWTGGATLTLNYAACDYVQNGNSVHYNATLNFTVSNPPVSGSTATITLNIPGLKTNYDSPNQIRSYIQLGTVNFGGLYQSGTGASGSINRPATVQYGGSASNLLITMTDAWDTTTVYASGNVITFNFNDIYFTN